MIIQWCLKGMALPSDEHARHIIDRNGGIACNWWRDLGQISPSELREQLTADALDRHVNHFDQVDPMTGRPFSEVTPFISLSAGTTERDVSNRTNWGHQALFTALRFGTNFGRSDTAYVYRCWLILAPRPSVEIEGVAEEIRDLNNYRRYSDYQTEGEVTAKIVIPDNQIQACEKWQLDRGRFSLAWTYPNPDFTSPQRLSNVREII